MKKHQAKNPASRLTRALSSVDRFLSREGKVPVLITPHAAFERYYRQAPNELWVQALAASISFLLDNILQDKIEIPHLEYQIEKFNAALQMNLDVNSIRAPGIHASGEHYGEFSAAEELDEAMWNFWSLQAEMENPRKARAEKVREYSLRGADAVIHVLNSIGFNDPVSTKTHIHATNGDMVVANIYKHMLG